MYCWCWWCAVTFSLVCCCVKLFEVKVFLFSVLQFTEHRLHSVFSLRTKLLMEKIVPCEAGIANLTFCPTHTHTVGHARTHILDTVTHICIHTVDKHYSYCSYYSTIKFWSTFLQNCTHYLQIWLKSCCSINKSCFIFLSAVQQMHINTYYTTLYYIYN